MKCSVQCAGRRKRHWSIYLVECPELVRERPGVWSVAEMMSFGETDLDRVGSVF